MSFDNTQTNSYIYRQERNDFINQTYFSDVYSYPPDENNINVPQLNPEMPNERFIQAATFMSSPEPNADFFMLVNRRCSPYYAPGTDPRFPNGENGGRRYFRVSFKPVSLNQSQNWRIIDLGNNSIVATFSGSSGQSIDLGWFLPGEGKLYKLEPA